MQRNYRKGFAINLTLALLLMLLAVLVIVLLSGALGENAGSGIRQIFSVGS